VKSARPRIANCRREVFTEELDIEANFTGEIADCTSRRDELERKTVAKRIVKRNGVGCAELFFLTKIGTRRRKEDGGGLSRTSSAGRKGWGFRSAACYGSRAR
jgi:hypothetical protein